MLGTPQTSTDPLAGLHGIELPPPPGFWPLAPGWWAVLLAVTLLVALLLWSWRRYRSAAPVRALERALDEEVTKLQQLAELGDARAYAHSADQLLRRVARHRLGERAVGLSGQSWQQWLIEQGPDDLRDANWHLLAVGRYQRPDPAADLSQLHQQCLKWLAHHRSC